MTPSPRCRILVVDDDADTVEMHARIVKTHAPSYRIVKAHNGREALDILRREHVDLVLLDLKMPRLDGFEVLQWIRRNPATKALPVVVLAGSSFRADIRRALELGANSYAAKPGRFEELQVLIDQIADVWLAREGVPG